MAFDLQRARDDTPGCKNVLHFNNAGASLMPKPVLDATIAHLQLEAQIVFAVRFPARIDVIQANLQI